MKKLFGTLISTFACLSMLSSTVSAEFDTISDNITNSYESELVQNATAQTEDFAVDEVAYDYYLDEIQPTEIGGLEYCAAARASYTRYNVNWTVEAGKNVTGTYEFNLNVGDSFYVEVSYTPVSSTEQVDIGIINTDNNVFTNVKKTTGSLTYYFDIKTAGKYKFRVKNETSSDITVTGYYYPITYTSLVNVPLIGQNNTNWCWAACIEMSAKSLGYSTYTQEDIVNKVKGTTADPYPNVVGSGDDYGKGMEYATSNTYTASESMSTISISSMNTVLSTGKPIIMAWGYYTGTDRTGGHANVIMAVDTKTNVVKMQDPANGGSTKKMKYSELTSNSSKKYDKTISITRK
ncbi:MAG: C39 family peptidase [Oscillospiraceae bacterium]|nr:C39 family peptidase [Oscillospiraceae bacterium]